MQIAADGEQDDDSKEISAGLEAEGDLFAKELPNGKPVGREILSQELVERWCRDAKENNSVAAFERLMKVRLLFQKSGRFAMVPSHGRSCESKFAF